MVAPAHISMQEIITRLLPVFRRRG